MKIYFSLLLSICTPFILLAQTDSLKPKTYTFVEQNPEFPGGDYYILKFIKEHSKYPTPDIRDGMMLGRKVLVRFVVESDGTTNEVTVVRGLTPELDDEAIRLVKLLPAFVPGRQQGKAVRVYFNLPVTFL